MVNARVELEDAEDDGRIGADRWEEIRCYVFPLIEAEAARLDAEYQRLRGGCVVGTLFWMLRIVGDLKAMGRGPAAYAKRRVRQGLHRQINRTPR